jgi:thiosulfate/3-mercaptopyruvate sulfurtransferase
MSSGDFSVAARIFWTFRAAGHSRLSILDGGWEGWADAGHPVAEGSPDPPARSEYPVRPDPSVRAMLADVERALSERSVTLVDSRGPKSFVGEEKSGQVARAGRLPGAVNVEGAAAYDTAQNRLRPPAELAQLFAPVPDGEVISYCNTGQAAATDWFVLSELLKRPNVTLYDGSMSEWAGDPARPVETGPAGAGRAAPA